MIKKILALALTILLGAFFIWSTIAKLESIDVYEITLVKQGLASWNMSRFVSRIFLALEMCIGLLLLFQYRLKKTTLPYTLGFLMLLTLFLLGRLLLVGNEKDCGCFGEVFTFSTLESISKNVALMLIIVVLWKNEVLFNFKKWDQKIVIGGVFFVSLISIIIYQPPINIYEEFSIDNFQTNDDFPVIENLSKEAYMGKSIIAFLSPNCGHCKHAAAKLKVLIDNKSDYKIYPVFGFRKNDIENFMDDVELKTSYTIIPKAPFLQMTQGVFPQIYVLEEGSIKAILNKRQFLEKNL